ncbi:MAG: aminoacyl-histidine dipeptidase [Solobacterium sp.]|nr:aminoacyl-histidine dipeptidase [Solobacterium sp.]
MSVFDGLEPKGVFSFFEAIAAIPHGSRDTKRISDYLVSFAAERGLDHVQDAMNNVIIRKPASVGYEDAPTVILQGHMDMVCAKEEGLAFDFHNDSLKLRLDNGIISAEGTTLGGDDGIAVAFMLAILDADDIPHPALECVFTVDEEIGMLGAAGLDKSQLKGRLMLNIDSEDEGILLASCAGGVRVNLHRPIAFETYRGVPLYVAVRDLAGGHSGVEIDKGRANANKVLGRILRRISLVSELRLESIEGGTADNAIASNAIARMLVADHNAAVREIAAIQAELKHEYAVTDPAIRLECYYAPIHEREAMDAKTTDDVIFLLQMIPDGIQRMSFDIAGLVETSLNLGIVKTEEGCVHFASAVRSSVESEKNALVEQIRYLAQRTGAQAELVGAYPAWEYRQDSYLRDKMVEVFAKQYGHAPVVKAIHAGLECGLFAGELEGLDAVSFGPDMKDIHTPKESMDVKSVQRTWQYLLEVLKEIR